MGEKPLFVILCVLHGVAESPLSGGEVAREDRRVQEQMAVGVKWGLDQGSMVCRMLVSNNHTWPSTKKGGDELEKNGDSEDGREESGRAESTTR